MNSTQCVTDTDQEGFLVNPERWSRELAMMMAQDEEVGQLSKEHWKVIETLRSYYIENHAPPSTREVCKETSDEKFCIANLFPSMLVAWKVAGLPNPGEEAKAYMSNHADDSNTK